MITLNDNPRVKAEARKKQLIKRREIVMKASGHEVGFARGVAARMYLNLNMYRRAKLISIINKELGQLEKFLKGFK